MKKTKKHNRQSPRNWVAVAAHFKTGAGPHGTAGKLKPKYSRKTKHKGKDNEMGS